MMDWMALVALALAWMAVARLGEAWMALMVPAMALAVSASEGRALQAALAKVARRRGSTGMAVLAPALDRMEASWAKPSRAQVAERALGEKAATMVGWVEAGRAPLMASWVALGQRCGSWHTQSTPRSHI